jgi:AmmeMemoRadiSam system protein B
MSQTNTFKRQSRPTAVAGLFYPDDPVELNTALDRYLTEAGSSMAGGDDKALIVPHAGYIYSGPVAATAYARLLNRRVPVDRVVLLGPSHRLAFRGVAGCSWRCYETPLGKIPLDESTMRQLASTGSISILDQAHRAEHSLEVHLPFLQHTLGKFTLLPLVVGDATAEQVGRILETVWGGDDTLIVISSDLSHYHHYDECRTLDRITSGRILDLDYDGLDYEDACGRTPISGLLWVSRRKSLEGQLLDLRNSGDTAGDRRQVVGYGAYAFH